MVKRNQDGRLVAVSGCLLFLFGIDGNSYGHWPTIFLIGLGIVFVVTSVRAIQYWHRMNEAASRSLGIKIDWRRGHHPPRKSAAYEAWCQAHNLDPYSAIDGS